jgi:translation initiation factor IF-2
MANYTVRRLTEEERTARAQALAEYKETARKRAEKEAAERIEREAAEARKCEEEDP